MRHVTYREMADELLSPFSRWGCPGYKDAVDALSCKDSTTKRAGQILSERALLFDIARSLRSIDRKLTKKARRK